MSNERIVDVDYTEVENSSSSSKVYYDIDEVSKILSIEISDIVYWCNKLADILNIQSIGAYMIFDSIDIENLKTIKKLNKDEKMTINEVRDYMNNHKQQLIIKKQPDLADISLINIVAKILQSQNEKIDTVIELQNKLLQFNTNFIETQTKVKNDIDELKKKTSSNNKHQMEILGKVLKGHENLDNKLDLIEQNAEQRDLDMSILLKNRMEERKKESESKKDKKGFLSKLFGK